MTNICVSVGTGIGSQKEIINSLAKAGYNVESAVEQWPRDTWVYFNGKYIERGDIGTDGNVFGDGGNVQIGKDFVMVSDNAVYYSNITRKLKETFPGVDFENLYEKHNFVAKNYELFSDLISSYGKQFFESRVHVAPTGYYQGKMGQTHIDMFTLLLPKSKILIFDNFFGKNANLEKHYNKIAEKESLQFIEYDGDKEGIWFPLNSLVLPRNGKDVVVIDSSASFLKKILYKKGIETICVNMPQINYPAGKINCQTNIYNLQDRRIIRKIENSL
jgi:hypothetical protein